MDETGKEVTALMRERGLFLVPLGNGDWCAGKGPVIYSMKVTEDHYADPRLSIASDPMKALLGVKDD